MDSPKQLENQIASFLSRTDKHVKSLIRKIELVDPTDSAQWLAWFDDPYADDFRNFLGEINNLCKEYNHILKG